MLVKGRSAESDLFASGKTTVIARYERFKIVFVIFTIAVLCIALWGFIRPQIEAGGPQANLASEYGFYKALIGLLLLMMFVPSLLYALYRIVFHGAAAVYIKDGWLICHHPLLGKIRVNDIVDLRIGASTFRRQSYSYLLIRGRSGQSRKLNDRMLNRSLEDIAEQISQQAFRQRNPDVVRSFGNPRRR